MKTYLIIIVGLVLIAVGIIGIKQFPVYNLFPAYLGSNILGVGLVIKIFKLHVFDEE